MTSSTSNIRAEFRKLGSKKIAEHSTRFFKTGPGEYGEGDKFLGIRVPVIRQFVKQKKDVPIRSILPFVRSPYHEERMLGLFSLVDRYKRGDAESNKAVYELYMKNLTYVNNWDLVDGTAHLIVGPQLEHASRKSLYKLAKSKDLWERRISIIATYHYIRLNDFDDTLALAEILRGDPEDLMHKAVGWMLREVGNRDRAVEEKFLKKHYRKMPRTMLRYAIERLPERRRKAYLDGRV